MLSGECNWRKEFMRGKNTEFLGHFQECIKRRAAKSLELMNIPSKISAEDTVTAVFSSCFNNTLPFIDIP